MSSIRPVLLAILGLVAAGCNMLAGIDSPTNRDQTDGAIPGNPNYNTVDPPSDDAATDHQRGNAHDAGVQDPTLSDEAAAGSPPMLVPQGPFDGGLPEADAGALCPTGMPAPNEVCRGIGLVCQYKNDPRGDVCRDTATCSETGWLTTRHICPDPPPTVCPATRAEARGTACSVLLAWCEYEQGLACQCTNCPTGNAFEDCGGPLTWHCQEPNSNASCPITLPNAGVACSPEGLSCVYNCGAFGARLCQKGRWIRMDGAKCPQINPP